MALSISAPAYAYEVTPAVAEQGYYVEADCENEPSMPLDVCGCESNVTYPTITGLGNTDLEASINRKLADQVMHSGCAEEGESMQPQVRVDGEKALHTTMVNNKYDVTYRSDKQLSILMEHSFYGAGAAHEMTTQRAIVVNLTNGEVASGSDALDMKQAKTINDYVHDELQHRNESAKEKGAYWLSDDDGNPKEYVSEDGCAGCQVYRDKDGWKMAFALYSVAPFSMGHVVMPIKESFIKSEWSKVQ